MSAIQVRVRSALLFRSQRREAGQVLEVIPLDAGELLASGRAELVDQTDAAAVRQAMVAQNGKVLAAAGGTRAGWR